MPQLSLTGRLGFKSLILSMSTYHALLTLDHEPLILVHATDAADHIIVFVMAAPSVMVIVGVVSLQRIRAVGLTGRLAHNLINLNSSLMTRTIVRLPQPAHITTHGRLTAIVFLLRIRKSTSEIKESNSEYAREDSLK